MLIIFQCQSTSDRQTLNIYSTPFSKILDLNMSIQLGQFADAPIDSTNRDGHTYIDEDNADWPESSDEPLSDLDDDIAEDVSIRVEDEDWENAERGMVNRNTKA